MMMNNASKSNEDAKIVDSETLVSQTQDRLWRPSSAVSNTTHRSSRAKNSFSSHVSTKVPLVITYADLVGSTNMSMTLPLIS